MWGQTGNILEGNKEGWSQPLSRVLSWAIIHLGLWLPIASCNLPGSEAGRPKNPYLVLLRVEFTVP